MPIKWQADTTVDVNGTIRIVTEKADDHIAGYLMPKYRVREVNKVTGETVTRKPVRKGETAHMDAQRDADDLYYAARVNADWF